MPQPKFMVGDSVKVKVKDSPELKVMWVSEQVDNAGFSVKCIYFNTIDAEFKIVEVPENLLEIVP